MKPHGLTVAERYQRLKKQGLCVQCGQRPSTAGPRGGKILCDRCREAQELYYRRKRRAEGNK